MIGSYTNFDNTPIKKNEEKTLEQKEYEKYFPNEPKINTIPKHVFQKRVEAVFKLVHETLARSFGPFGAPTLISSYPYMHVTKDGYTIDKNLSMDVSKNIVDQAILDMISDICGRLNYSVGDGTTTAVTASYSIYKTYMLLKDLSNILSKVPPREILSSFEEIKDEVVDELGKYIRKIDVNDIRELRDTIKQIVYISSNGDNELTNIISGLYEEIKCPAIICRKSEDGSDSHYIINGYKFDTILNDKIYINKDDNTMLLSDTDVIIFSCKITKEIYEDILVPVNEESRRRSRHLIVLAPSYDEVAMTQVIRRQLNNEYERYKDINMVLMSYRMFDNWHRMQIEDFAMLCNTTIINRSDTRWIIEKLKENGGNIHKVFNMDMRSIPHLNKVVLIYSGNDNKMAVYNDDKDLEDISEFKTVKDMIDLSDDEMANLIRVGFVGECNLGIKESVFKNFYYDKNKYNRVVSDAKDLMIETEDKYSKLGTFNMEAANAENRYYSLLLKMGVIEIGGDSELTQKYRMDSAMDAVKASASAFKYGVIKGCNISLIGAINTRYNLEKSELKKELLNILKLGFKNVYLTLLENSFGNLVISKDAFNSDNNDPFIKKLVTYDDAFKTINEFPEEEFSINDLIFKISEKCGLPFNVVTMTFDPGIINSFQTDYEILTATIDLISILISGNQLVVTNRHNFN